MSTESLSFQNPVIKYGILGGVVYVLLTTILYEMGISFLTGYWRIVPFAAICFIAIYAAIEQKKTQGGYITFTQALFTVFLCFLIIELFWVIYMILLYHVIDPDLAAKVKVLVLEKLQGLEAKLGKDMLNKYMGKVSNRNFSFNVKNALIDYGVWAVIYFAISLIAAAILRKEEVVTE